MSGSLGVQIKGLLADSSWPHVTSSKLRASTKLTLETTVQRAILFLSEVPRNSPHLATRDDVLSPG